MSWDSIFRFALSCCSVYARQWRKYGGLGDLWRISVLLRFGRYMWLLCPRQCRSCCHIRLYFAAPSNVRSRCRSMLRFHLHWHPSMLQSSLRPWMLHSTHTQTRGCAFGWCSLAYACSWNSNLSCCGREGRPVKRIDQGVIAVVVSALICTTHVLVEPTIDAQLSARLITHPSSAALSPHLGTSCCAFLASCCAILCALTSSSVLVVALFSALSPAPSGYFVEPTINPMSSEPACAFGFRSLKWTIDYGISCCALGFNASSGDKYLICGGGGDDRSRSKRTSSRNWALPQVKFWVREEPLQQTLRAALEKFIAFRFDTVRRPRFTPPPPILPLPSLCFVIFEVHIFLLPSDRGIWGVALCELQTSHSRGNIALSR